MKISVEEAVEQGKLGKYKRNDNEIWEVIQIFKSKSNDYDYILEVKWEDNTYSSAICHKVGTSPRNIFGDDNRYDLIEYLGEE